MACRVGITTDESGRCHYWQQEHPTLRNWRILERGLSYSDAQRKENEYAQSDGCVSHPGGPDDGSNDWLVYRFEY